VVVNTFCLTKEIKIKNPLKLFSRHKFIMARCDKNVIHDSTIQKKKAGGGGCGRKKLYDDVAHYSTSY
jgi:hypothetical protein